MFLEDLESAKAKGIKICQRCEDILTKNNGMLPIECCNSEIINLQPMLWRHSEVEDLHALIKVDQNYVIACGIDDYDLSTLKRIKPFAQSKSVTFNICIKGIEYSIIDAGIDGYQIINKDGSIVKNPEVEAVVFNHMIKIKGII